MKVTCPNCKNQFDVVSQQKRAADSRWRGVKAKEQAKQEKETRIVETAKKIAATPSSSDAEAPI